MGKGKYEKLVEPKLRQVETWAMDGLSENQIAKNLGVAYSTFREYKEKFSALSAVLMRGKAVSDLEVENALYKKSLGYNVKITKHHKVKRVEFDPVTGKKIVEREELVAVLDEVHVPADTQAEMFWLCNRRGDRWSYKPTLQAKDGEDSGVIVLPEINPSVVPGEA